VFDTGAQSIVPYSSELTAVMLHQLDTADLLKIQTPVFIHEHLRVTAGEAKRAQVDRYCYLQGIAELPRLLQTDIEVRFDQNVSEIESTGNGYQILGEHFDAVVLALPVPQASLLLWGLGQRKATGQSRYRACLSVQLGFEVDPPTSRYHALMTEEETHPLQWLSLETVKAPGRSPAGTTAIVAQLNPSFSRTAWDWDDDRIVAAVTGYITTLFGQAWMRAAISRVKRWKYSQPEAIALFDTVNHRGDRVIVAGDGVMGGRIEYAFASGLRAARLLMDERREK
jgi:hypothetical protein